MASIQKRVSKNGQITYRVEIRLKGAKPVSKSFKRKTDAAIWANQTEAAIRERRYFKTAESERHTLAELVDRQIEMVLPQKPKIQKAQTMQLTWWKDQLGHYLLADITPALITECRDRLLTEPRERLINGKMVKGEPLSASTVNRYLAAISHAFTMAVNEWGWMDDSPMRKVSKPKEPRGRIRFLSDDEHVDGELIEGERTRLLRACEGSSNPFLHPVVVLALSTGMRNSEIMNLKWNDIDLVRNQITLHETKNGEIRVIPLAGKALDLVKNHPRRLDTPLLFPSHVHKHKPQDLRAPWLKALEEAGIENFRFHDLRHSAASYLAMDSASLAEIAAVLGHKTLQMVKRYAHLSEAHTASVVASMNKRFIK